MRLALSALALLIPGAALAGNNLPPLVAVPEPTTLALVAAAVGGLALARKLRGPRR